MRTNSNQNMRTETSYQESKLPAKLLSVSEVARFLGVHPSTIRRWGKKGLLKSYAIGLGHNLRFKQEDVLNFLDQCQEENRYTAPLASNLAREKRKIESGRR